MPTDFAALDLDSHPDGWPMRSAADRFASVVEAVPTALLVTGQEGLVEMVNLQAERMFGYSRAEIHGQPLEILMPERFRHPRANLRDQFLIEATPRLIDESSDLSGRRKDGTEFPIEIGLNRIDLDGRPMVLAGIVDVTLRRQLDREREQLRQDLQRSNSDLEEFAYAASHDLKAPLRGIAHLVQWITDDIQATANPETIENLLALTGRVGRMKMLLDGLLAYSRVGQADSPIELVDLRELIQDVVKMLAPPPGFTITCEGEIGSVRTHRAPIQVVLENLIDNAIRHHDRETGRVAITMRQSAGEVEVRVTDDGPGIPPAYHEKVFLIFHTLHSRDERETGGIGLAIVKRKVQCHGGRIWIESAPPARGASFVFTWKDGG